MLLDVRDTLDGDKRHRPRDRVPGPRGENRIMISSAQRLLLAVPVLVLMLTGCAGGNGAPSAPNRIERGEPHTAALAASVERLQQQVAEGDWTPAAGGNVLVRCESASGDDSAQRASSYRFYGSWRTPADQGVPADLAATAEEFSRALSAQGWSDVEMESSESPAYWRVWATDEDAEIAEAMVTWHPEGTIDAAEPHVVLDVDSTCSPADATASPGQR